MPSSYALGAYYEKWVKEQVASGRYNNASEVIRDALRLLQRRDMTRAWTIDELREAIQLGRDSGPDVAPETAMRAVDEDFAELERFERSKLPKAAE